MIGRTNAKGLSDKSWANYIAVKNRTKTTIESGDIDFSKITGASSAAYILHRIDTLTKIVANFETLNGSGCLSEAFRNCTSLTTLELSLPVVTTANYLFSAITGCTAINNIIMNGISNSNSLWGSTSAASNLFANDVLVNCKNLTITVAILPNLYLAVMTSLNLASVVQVLGQLHNYSGGTAHTITFNRAFTGLSAGDYALIDAAKTTAVARNWTVAGLTYSM